jgi:hypothetical protein
VKIFLKTDYSDRDDDPKAGDIFKVLDIEYDEVVSDASVFCYYAQSLKDGESYVLYPEEVGEYINE